MKLAWSDEALDALAQAGFDPAYGARPLRRAIRAQVEDPAAEALLAGRLRKGGTARLDCRAGRTELTALPPPEADPAPDTKAASKEEHP